MAFPTPFADNVYSLRVYETGTASADFVDNEFEFFHPNPDKSDNVAWSQAIRISATTQDLEISFDGTNVHGKILAGTEVIYWDRHESGIAVRGLNSVFQLEAW